MTEHYSPILLSLKCASWSALLNIPWGVFWGWVLARKAFKGKLLVQTALYIPLVLPPVLTGYFLLVILSKNAWLGQWFYSTFGIEFVLDWKGAVIAGAIVSSPFMIQLVKEAVEKVDARLEMAARSLGAKPARIFWTVTLPLAWQGILAGFFLVFARSLGEFGATIMIAGNIPQKTQTIPTAIYSKFYLGQDSAVIPLVIAAIAFSYIGLTMSYVLNRKPQNER